MASDSRRRFISRIIDSAQYFDSRNFIKTVRQFNKHVVDFPATESLVRSVFDRFPEKWQLCQALYLLIKKMAI